MPSPVGSSVSSPRRLFGLTAASSNRLCFPELSRSQSAVHTDAETTERAEPPPCLGLRAQIKPQEDKHGEKSAPREVYVTSTAASPSLMSRHISEHVSQDRSCRPSSLCCTEIRRQLFRVTRLTLLWICDSRRPLLSPEAPFIIMSTVFRDLDYNNDVSVGVYSNGCV